MLMNFYQKEHFVMKDSAGRNGFMLLLKTLVQSEQE